MGTPQSSRIGQMLHSPAIAIPEVFKLKHPNLKYRDPSKKHHKTTLAPKEPSKKREITSTLPRKKRR